MLLFLSINAFFTSAVMSPDYIELVNYRSDYLFITIPAFLLFCAAMFFLLTRVHVNTQTTKKAEYIYCGLTLLLGSCWVFIIRLSPQEDQAAIQNYVAEYIRGNYSSLNRDEYMGFNPHQLGYAFISELFQKIFAGNSTVMLQLLNVVCAAACGLALLQICRLLFNNNKIQLTAIVLLAGFLPSLFYTTFVYGQYLGLAFALWAFVFALHFLNSGKKQYLLLTFLFCPLAVCFKSNYFIFVIAIVITFLLKFISKPSILTVASAVILIFLSSNALLPVKLYYQAQSGIQIGNGMPKILWAAMGIQESPRAPGWYNEYNFSTYVISGYDDDIAKNKAKNDIAVSLQNFSETPSYAVEFFYRKISSQWSEPTFSAMVVNYQPIDIEQATFRTKLLTSIFYGALKRILYYWMDIWQFIIYFFALLGILSKRKNIVIEHLMPILAVIGGFLFHTVWEGKSQYIWPYFILLIPYAAAGVYAIPTLFEKFRHVYYKHKKSKQH